MGSKNRRIQTQKQNAVTHLDRCWIAFDRLIQEFPWLYAVRSNWSYEDVEHITIQNAPVSRVDRAWYREVFSIVNLQVGEGFVIAYVFVGKQEKGEELEKLHTFSLDTFYESLKPITHKGHLVKYLCFASAISKKILILRMPKYACGTF
jgi:hypothetical protein